MKNIKLLAVFILALGFLACGGEDEDDNSEVCKTCTNGPVSSTICDKKDGTIVINGEDPIKIPEGSSFEAIADATCKAIGAE